jgi:molybdopterin-dependent oxidoreductase alpha subunit
MDREARKLEANLQETEELKTSEPVKSAGGLPAVVSTIRHSLDEMNMTRALNVLLKVNQTEGFDCQSCAWPNPDNRHVAEFCENGAKAVAAEATTRRVTPEFFKRWTISELEEKSDYWLNKQGRITSPVVLREGNKSYEQISWEDAFNLIATELNSLQSPDEAIFYTSGRTSNEAAFLYQLFVRQFGTNNLPDCSDMCHESSGKALSEVIGVGKGTVRLEDFELADTIFIIGQNPGSNHPRMLTSLEAAKRNGCRIVTINPLPEVGTTRFKNPQNLKNPLKLLPMLVGRGTELTDLFIQVRIGGDAAVLKGIMKVMLEEEEKAPGKVLDKDFINRETKGFEDFRTALAQVSWSDIITQSGVSIDKIREAARIAIKSKRMITCWAMGLTQHERAVYTIQEIVNLSLLRGQLGRPGAGLCPVRGHSNVQGDRTMGIWERPSKEFLEKLALEFNFSPPTKPGWDTVESINAMHKGEATVFVALGGNFLSATPDTNYTSEALRRCRLTVHISTKLNRSHLVTGKQALILPCLGRTEEDIQVSGRQFVTVEDSMSVVSRSQGVLPPASEELLSEPVIVARMAEATLRQKSSVDWRKLTFNYDAIRDHISHVIPGFENFNNRIKKASFYLPNSVREGEFSTSDGRAIFTVHSLPEERLEEGQLVMMTIRSHDQFNTTIYGLNDRYRGVYNSRKVIFLNSEDISRLGFTPGQLVDITSHYMSEQRTANNFAVVPYDIPKRCAATYYPETNLLVPINSVAHKSNTPTSKYVIISLKAVKSTTT